MICDDREIEMLTKRKIPAAQARALSAMGIRFMIRPDRSIVVSRAHVEHLLGAPTATPAKRKNIEPDFSALS